jgi:cell division protein FtsI/penicillin-binding protein 2
MKTSSFSIRVRFIFVGILVFAALLIVKLYFLQIVKGSDFSEKADRQYVNVSRSLFDRGNIFFTTKSGSLVSAATLKTTYILSINPKLIANPEEVYKKLSEFLTIDAATFYSKATKKDDPYEEILKRIPEDTIKKIEPLKIPGVIVEKERWRYYPGNTISSRLIGFVGYNGDSLEGRYGLEKYYDDVLKRSPEDLYVNVFAEIFSNISKTFSSNKEREGDIITSIEPEVQGFADKKAEEVNKQWSSSLTGIIIIDPKNGEIYAMGNAPTFNLNDFGKEKDLSVFSNPSISNSYEIGSVMKAITMTSGIDSGAINAKSTWTDLGYATLDGKKITNVDKNARGLSTMQDVLSHSMNTGTTYIMQKMGKAKLAEYFEKFGMGIETGIDLPNEVAGNINNLKSPRDLEYATASFGQGISLTPINATRAFSVIANGGKLITPHVVKKINYKVGLSKNISYTNEARQIVSKEATEDVTRMLVEVVDKALIQGKYKQDRYSVAAKTGTAQMARPANEGGGYYSDKFLHTFFGYFPAYNPRFLVFLYTIDPKNIDFGSQTLSGPFFDIVKFLINYYQIPPDR